MDATTTVTTGSIINKVHRDFRIPDTGWYDDAIQWVHDALAEIGTPFVLSHCTKTVKVKEGKVKIPCTIDLFIGVKKDNCFLTRIDKNIKTTGAILTTKYQINGVYILLDYLDNTEFELHYKSFPVDCDGFPLIPNMQSVRNAVTWKIMLMLIQGGYQHPTIDYKTAFDMYENKYKGLATNDLQMPTPDQMDSISQDWRSVGLGFNNNQRIYES